MDNLNKRANDVFDGIKKRRGWTTKIVSEMAQTDTSIDANKLQKMLDSTPKTRVEVDDIVHHFTEKFDSAKIDPIAYLDSLELSANLSIAIAAIIEYKTKGNKKSLVAAVEYIEKELHNV